MVGDFAEVVHHRAAEPAPYQRADSNRKKCEAHVRALLSGRRKTRDVCVIGRLLNDFADGKHGDGNDCAYHRWPE